MASTLLNPDVLFQPTFSVWRAGFPVPLVTTIHDVTPFVMPNFTPVSLLRKMRVQLKWAVNQSRHLIAISESCRKDLIEVFQVPPSRITVVHSGFNRKIFNPIPLPEPEHLAYAQRHGIERPYLFHHGLMQPRKNLKRLIQAYALLLSQDQKLQLDLVLAGQLDWKGEELLDESRKIPPARGKVIFTGPLPDQELAALLKRAQLAVIPSLYEGFCLPLVEAMASGVATVCSNASCLPEISGGVLRYFNPESMEEIAACMESVLANEGERQNLRSAGLARAASFDWGKTAVGTLRALVNSSRRSA